MKTPTSKSAQIAPAVALVSAAVISYEIGLTRLFSFILPYHFTFIVVSGAVCGLGLGAVLARRRRRGLRRRLGVLGLVCGLSMALATAALTQMPTSPGRLLAGWAGMPFVVAGAFLATAFGALHRQSQGLYFWDLAGAALGTLFIIFCLVLLGGVNGLLAASLLAAAGGGLVFAAGPRPLPALIFLGLSALAALVLLLRGQTPMLPIDLIELGQRGHKPMFRGLVDERNPGRLLDSRWSAYARTDLVDRTGDTGLNIYTDGGAGSYMFRFGGDFRKVWFLRGEAAFFPYYFGRRERALILGPGGGADVLYALMCGWRQIEGVEINGDIVAAVQRLGQYNGHIYALDNVKIHVGDGRNFLERAQGRYDLITLPLVYAQAAELAGYALLENYLFTKEAFRRYMDRLEEGGTLALVVHNHRLMLRVVATLAALVEESGQAAGAALARVVVINGTRAKAGGEEAYRPLILIKKQAFEAAELLEIGKTAKALQLRPYFVPGYLEPAALSRLQGQSLAAFVASAAEDIEPATDDRPFFYRQAAAIERLGTALGAGLALVLLLLGLACLGRGGRARGRGGWVLFAAGVGCGYMLIEIHLLQRLGLFLGRPVLTLAVALFGLLLASAVGSLVGRRWLVLGHKQGLGLAALLTVVVCGLTGLLQNALLPAALPLALYWRAGLALLLVAPVGVAMGLCFPAGLRQAGRADVEHIAWMWGVNGAASVVGSVAAIWLAMGWGNSWALGAGMACYGLVALGLGLWGRGEGPPPLSAPLGFGWIKGGTFLLVVLLLWYGALYFAVADQGASGGTRPAPKAAPVRPSLDQIQWP